jgi:hypothetical protein
MKASSGTTKRLASSHRAKEGARFQLIRNTQLFSNSNDNQKATYFETELEKIKIIYLKLCPARDWLT